MDNKTYPAVAAMDSVEGSPLSSWERIDPGSLRTGDDVDHREVVILVVGNKGQDKSGVVESLTKGGDWDDSKTADTRILTCKSSARIIVDTTPLQNAPGRSPTAIARRWISRNSLRRILLGKDVVVVCVVTRRVRNTCKYDMFSYSNCWVDVFGLIFKSYKQAIMILVNTEGTGTDDVPQDTKSQVERFVQEHGLSTKNITYSNVEGGDDSVLGVIEDSISLRKRPKDWRHRASFDSFRQLSPRLDRPAADGRRGRQAYPSVVPVTIGEVLSEKERFGPWGPERVILFGRTGSGKSTLAQMLTLGKLDKENSTFVPSAGIRGGTAEMQPGVGRGWYVLDTPGFGEPTGKDSTVSTRDVEQKIKHYVKMVEGTFSHYLYVVKKDRLDILEERLWTFFMLLFGNEIKQQFSVVISGADEKWVLDNRPALQSCFEGCESFISADFPPIDEKDEELEIEYEEIRRESLLELEGKLAKLARADMHCKYGKSSRMHLRIEKDRTFMDLGIERNERIKFLVRGASILFACCNVSQRPLSELTNLLKVEFSQALGATGREGSWCFTTRNILQTGDDSPGPFFNLILSATRSARRI